MYEGRPAIAKIATLEGNVQRIERETWAYSVLDGEQKLQEPRVAPRFLGHLTEHGRVMGLLLGNLEGRHPSVEDLESCREKVGVVHRLGLIHGDFNRYNFIVDGESGRVKLVDFEHAELCNEETARAEIEFLVEELGEHSGRGGSRASVKLQDHTHAVGAVRAIYASTEQRGFQTRVGRHDPLKWAMGKGNSIWGLLAVAKQLSTER